MAAAVPEKSKKTAALARREPPSRCSKAPRAELVPKPSKLDDAARCAPERALAATAFGYSAGLELWRSSDACRARRWHATP
jgi:hypothetical protein